MSTAAAAQVRIEPVGREVTWVSGLGARALVPDGPTWPPQSRLPPLSPSHRPDARARLVVPGPRPDQGLPSFQSATALAAQVLDRLGDAGRPLAARYAKGLRLLDPGLLGEPGARPRAMAAHAPALAMFRQLSRDSVGSATLIDQAAAFLRDAIRKLAGGRPTTLVIGGLDLLDRPSLRVLNRLVWLAEPADQLHLVGLCHGDPLAGQPVPDPPRAAGGGAGPDEVTRFLPDEPVEPLGRRRYRSRRRLWRRLAEEWLPRRVPAGPSGLAGHLVLPSLPAGGEPGNGLVSEVAEELAGHNYDRAYLLAEWLLTGSGPALAADLWRMVGLCDAHLGEPDLAAAAFTEALTAARRPGQRAHLHYLRGLVLTGHEPDLAAADREHERGLAELNPLPPRQPAGPDPGGAAGRDDIPLERAWLINGRALVASLRAGSAAPGRRAAILHEVLRAQLDALRLISTGRQARRTYLRRVLLSRIASVLAQLGEADAALEFWKHACGQYLDHSAGPQPLDPGYLYRAGMLAWQAGRTDEARRTLETTRQLAELAGDRFGAERICYALAYLRLDTGPAGVAVAEFRAGLRRAWQVRDPLACLAQAQGLAAAARAAGRPRLVRALPRWLRLTGHPRLRGTTDADLDRPPKRPPPTLPTHLPGIDLEPAPDGS